MTVGCNIWWICLKLNGFFLRSESCVATFSICMDVTFFSISRFNSFLLTDATDRSKISGDQKRFFIALSLYPLSFFANTPFKVTVKKKWKGGISINPSILGVDQDLRVLSYVPLLRNWYKLCLNSLYENLYTHNFVKNIRFKQIIFSK